MFEADLEKALLLSKLEYEEHKQVLIYLPMWEFKIKDFYVVKAQVNPSWIYIKFLL